MKTIFVLRHRELDTILNALRSTPNTAPPQHLLITGQRGMGKSTLLRRVALAVDEDPDLSQTWIPLRFPEEQYTVSTPAELWSNVIEALADALERQNLPTADIDTLIEQLAKLPSKQREDDALNWLTQWCNSHQRRLMLLVDSTDLLFSGLASGDSAKDDGSAAALWRVRRTLLHSTCMFWIGGSYQPLEAEGLYGDAFLDFFQLIELRPLTLDEMQIAIRTFAHIFGFGGFKGDDAVAEVMKMLQARPERLRAMRQLTGGNLRTTIMLYELFAAGGRSNLRADLERLLDVMTPYYKARLEILPDQQRKIFAHVMEHWSPIMAKSLAQAAGLGVGIISAQLSRLEQNGSIEKTPMRGTKRSGYQSSERFFNIWYLMRNSPRRARARVGWLIEFMRLWYSSDELQGLARIRLNEHRDGFKCNAPELEYSRAMALALPEESPYRTDLDWEVFQQARKDSAFIDLYELQGEDANFSIAHNYLARFDAVRESLQADQREGKPELGRAITSAPHLTLAEKEEFARDWQNLSAKKLDDIRAKLTKTRNSRINIFGQKSVEEVEEAVFNGTFLPDCPDSTQARRQMSTRFASNPNTYLIALERLSTYHRDSEIEKICHVAISLCPNSGRPWNVLGNILSINTERVEEAESAYREAIKLSPGLAGSWMGLGNLLCKNADRIQEAEAAYRKAIELKPKFGTPWLHLGDLLQSDKNQIQEAEAAYRRAIELVPESATPWLRLGDLLQNDKSLIPETEAAYRKAIELDQKWATPWLRLGDLLSNDKNRIPEAEAAYRKAIELNLTWSTPLSKLANLLAKDSNRANEAESLYREAIKLKQNSFLAWSGFGDLISTDPQRADEAEAAFRNAIKFAPTWATPHVQLGDLLNDLERIDEAEAAYRAATALNPKWSHPWSRLGDLLMNIDNRTTDAEAAFRQAVKVNPKLGFVWWQIGLLISGDKLRFDEAEAAFRKAIELEPEREVAWAALADLLSQHPSRTDEAGEAFVRAIKLDPKDATAWITLGDLFRENRIRIKQAEAAYHKAIEIAPKQANAWNSLGELLQDCTKDYANAEMAYRKAIEFDDTSPFQVANLARLLARQQRSDEARILYRQSLELSGSGHDNLQLQANCWLGNHDLALQALDSLAERASAGDQSTFAQLKTQCFECHTIDLAGQLIALMEESRFSDFLLPFSLALRTANGEKDALMDVAVEVRTMAEAVLAQIVSI